MAGRDLPSISQLTAFEAVCRLGSTQGAAAEMGVTQGAVSKLVAGLEARLGVPLFRREGRHLVPLEVAAEVAGEVGAALDRIGRGMERLAGGAVLSLAVLPGFAARWLAPRLARFRARHPGVRLQITTRVEPCDLAAEGFDAAVHFGQADWAGAAHLKLWDDQVLPCAAPALAALASGAGLAGLPLLRLETRPRAWAGWFARSGGAGPAEGMRFDQFAPMIEAAVHGLGVALLPDFLAEADLASGRLVALEPARPGGGAYWLVWPETARGSPALAAFRDWLAAEAAVRWT